MPKEVLRTGASAPTETAASPAASTEKSPRQIHLDQMDAQLRAMALDDKLIKGALENAAKKWDAEHPPEAAKPAEPAAAEKTVTPPAEIKKVIAVAKKPDAPKPPEKNVTPAPQKTEEELEMARRAAEDGHSGGDENESEPQGDGGDPTDDGHTEEENHVVVRSHWHDASDGALSGPIDKSDFKIPQLKLVQGSGPLSKKFNQGTLIFMDQTIFEAPPPDKLGPPLKFIPVSLRKYFRENLKRPENPPAGYVQPNPRNADTPEMVAKLGGTTEFTDDGAGNRLKPSWGPAACITLLIERPEGNEHPGFAIAVEVAGKMTYFAAAVIYVNGGQYRSMAKPIIDACQFILVEGTGPEKKIVLEKRVWKMQVAKEQSGENMVFNPKVEMVMEMTTADLRGIAQSMRGKSSKVEAES